MYFIKCHIKYYTVHIKKKDVMLELSSLKL